MSPRDGKEEEAVRKMEQAWLEDNEDEEEEEDFGWIEEVLFEEQIQHCDEVLGILKYYTNGIIHIPSSTPDQQKMM